MSDAARDALDALARAGSARPPAPDPAFVADLEAGLHAGHGAGTRATVAPRRIRARWVAGAAAALLALLVGVLASTADGPRSVRADVVLASATGAVVELPGGARLVASAGLSLPEGARVVVGPAGEVAAHGVRLGPGEVGLVVDGRLRRQPESAASAPSTAAPLRPADGGAPGSRGTGEPSPSPAPRPRAGEEPAPERSTVPSTAPTRRDADGPTTSARPPTTSTAIDPPVRAGRVEREAPTPTPTARAAEPTR